MIEWSLRARTDLQNLKTYIAKDSPYYARHFIERLLASVENLETFPQIGRPVPEAEGHEEIRELIFHNYRIIYRVLPGQIQILTIVHGSRNLTGRKIKPWCQDP